MSRQTVSEIGEFALIDRLRAALPEAARAGTGLALGIGDDAALWQPPTGATVVVTTDSMVEGVHFKLEWGEWAALGHKALAVNLSDLAAMGAEAGIAVVTLGLRGSEAVDDLEDLYAGLGALGARTGTVVAGGDIVASPAALAIHVTAIGSVTGNALTRAGARPGDAIAVTGTLGAAAAGLALLAMEPTDQRRTAATAALLLDAQLRPEPRLEMGRALRSLGANAAMDLSDGIFGDLPKLLTASGAGARLHERRIPVAAAVRALFPGDWMEYATRGGEDYELLFAASASAMTAIIDAATSLGSQVSVIGEVIAGEPCIELMRPDGSIEIATAGAFDHFRPPTSTSG